MLILHKKCIKITGGLLPPVTEDDTIFLCNKVASSDVFKDRSCWRRGGFFLYQFSRNFKNILSCFFKEVYYAFIIQDEAGILKHPAVPAKS